MLLFLISCLRAIVEMLALCLIAQAVLYVLAGQGRECNPIYRFFALVSRGPQQVIARCLPKSSRPLLTGMVTLLLLFFVWIGLAILRRFL